MQAALKIGEQHRDGLETLLVRKVLQAFFADFIGGNAVQPVGLGLQVQSLKLIVREREKIT